MNRAEITRRKIQYASYILGLISIWILGGMIGDNGIAYLAIALEAFYVIWSIVGQNVSDTLGKLLRYKNSRGQYKNAVRMRRNIFIQQCVSGILGSAILFLSAGVLAEKVFRTPYSKVIIMLLAPVILIRSISEVVIGYFQGSGSEMPAAVAAILRQVFFLGFALLFGNILGNYGEKVSALLWEKSFSSMYGGIGIALAVLLAELLVALFLCMVRKGSRPYKQVRDSEAMSVKESFVGQLGLFYRNMSGKILLCLLESLPLWLGAIFYQKSVQDRYAAADNYGVYFGKYLVLCGLVVLLLLIFITEMNAKVYDSVRKEKKRYTKVFLQNEVRVVLIHTLFFAVFVGITAKYLALLLGGENHVLLEKMLMHGSALMLGVALAFLFTRLLLLLGKELFVCACAGIADVIFVIATVLLLNAGNLGIMALVYAGMIGIFVYAILSGLLAFRQLRVNMEWKRTVAFPVVGACLMGLLCYFLCKLLAQQLGNFVAILLCLVLGYLFYWAVLILLRCFKEKELALMPGGRIIQAIRKLMHV